MPGKVSRFEDLAAWQKARELAKAIYCISQDGSFARDYGLARQIQQAAVSTMSNIAERFERMGLREFYRMLSIAKASCAEVRSQLYIASDIGYQSKQQFIALMNQANEVANIIGGLRASIERKLKEDEGTT